MTSVLPEEDVTMSLDIDPTEEALMDDHAMDDLPTSGAPEIQRIQGPHFTAIPEEAEKATALSNNSTPIREKGKQVEHNRTLEGGPERDPRIRKAPSKRPPAVPPPAQQKIMSARLLGRLVDYQSDEESQMDSDGSEDDEDEDGRDGDGQRRSSRLKAKPTSTQFTSTQPTPSQPSSRNSPPSPVNQADDVVDEEDFWGPDPSQNPWLETPVRRSAAPEISSRRPTRIWTKGATWFNTSIDVLCANESLMDQEIW
jgi:hypothetical protein